MLEEYIQRYQTPLFIGLLLIVALSGWFVFVAIQNVHTRTIALSVLPSDATVTVNGISTKLAATTRLPIGIHSITVSKEGFSTKTVEVVIGETIDYENYEPIALSPVSEEAKKWVEENNTSYGDFYDSLTLIDPVFAYLPSKNLIYSIESSSTSTPVVLNTATLGSYKNAPIDYLKRSGLNPSNYSYTFNYKNPFEMSSNE